MDEIKYCVTRWGAVLKVASVNNSLVDVSDPDAVDAGMFISDREVERFWFGWRLKDKSPQDHEKVEVLTKGGQVKDDYFVGGEFQHDLRTESKYDKVILWRKRELPY